MSRENHLIFEEMCKHFSFYSEFGQKSSISTNFTKRDEVSRRNYFQRKYFVKYLLKTSFAWSFITLGHICPRKYFICMHKTCLMVIAHFACISLILALGLGTFAFRCDKMPAFYLLLREILNNFTLFSRNSLEFL